MDSPTERMPIACVHCAKAKAKCDKKVSNIYRSMKEEGRAVCSGEDTDCCGFRQVPGFDINAELNWAILGLW